MSIENNPLKQYFRRPSIFLKLPSGGAGYDPTVLQPTETGELPIFPMTAIDEISSKTPDSLYNGTAVADIIKSCVPNIKNPWAISSVDLDAILVAIKIATNGNEMELETNCPSCKEDSSFGLNLSFVLSNFTAGDYNQPLMIDDLRIKFKPLTYKELTTSTTKQVEIQRGFLSLSSMEEGPEKEARSAELLKIISQSTVDVLSNVIEYIATPEVVVQEKAYIQDFLVNVDKRTFELIREASIKLRETTQIKPLHIQCSNCKHEYDQPFTLNISDFFD